MNIVKNCVDFLREGKRNYDTSPTAGSKTYADIFKEEVDVSLICERFFPLIDSKISHSAKSMSPPEGK